MAGKERKCDNQKLKVLYLVKIISPGSSCGTAEGRNQTAVRSVWRHETMKRLLPALIICLLCLSAAGCGNSDGTRTDPQESVQTAYKDATVSFLGPEGTYTQEACEVFFDKQGSYVPYETVPDAVKALAAGQSDYAVIPQENTIGGAVTDYLDTLITNTEVSVTGEVELPISQNLLVIPGTELSDLKTVYSHKQGIAQGKEWLEKNLPDAEVIEVSSTAEGARMVSEGKDRS